MRNRKSIATTIIGAGWLASAGMADASTVSVTVHGTDSIFLAGRTDITIPPADQDWGDYDPNTYDGMLRHGVPTPEELQETLPPIIDLTGIDYFQLAAPATGGISFFNGEGGITFGPEGNTGFGVSILSAFSGISGYIGPQQGPLTGVFLTDDIPNGGTPPDTLIFTAGELGIDFLELAPGLGQIFFIGDGQTSGGELQKFFVPDGATRLALGVPDGFDFGGVPGAYDDNDGAYQVVLDLHEVPAIPLPATLPLFAGGLGLLGLLGWRRKRTAVR